MRRFGPFAPRDLPKLRVDEFKKLVEGSRSSFTNFFEKVAHSVRFCICHPGFPGPKLKRPGTIIPQFTCKSLSAPPFPLRIWFSGLRLCFELHGSCRMECPARIAPTFCASAQGTASGNQWHDWPCGRMVEFQSPCNPSGVSRRFVHLFIRQFDLLREVLATKDGLCVPRRDRARRVRNVAGRCRM